MSAFLIILGYIVVCCELLWYLTCTKHKDVPLILVLIITIFSFIPGLDFFMAIIDFLILWFGVTEGVLELKNNWFNRTFLAFHE